MEYFKYLKNMLSIMSRILPNKNPPKYSIIAGEYVVAIEPCRWEIVFQNGYLHKKIPNVSSQSYEKKLKNASNVYPLLLPFGTVYLLFSVEIGNNTVNLNIQSFYKDAQIPVDYLGLLTYVATEIIRNGYYNQDDFLKIYKPYYDKIKQKMPEKYEIIVNGEFADIDLKILYEWTEEFDEDFPVTSIKYNLNPNYNFNKICLNCPLRNICDIRRPNHYSFPLHNFFSRARSLLGYIGSEITRDHIYFNLSSGNIDPILFAYIYIFKYFYLSQNNREYPAVIKYLNSYSNKCVLLNAGDFIKLPTILCLNDGELYEDIFELRKNYPSIRVIGRDGDMTTELTYREIARKSIAGFPPCLTLEEYLSKNYSNKERNLFYFVLLNFNLDKEYAKNNIFLVKTVYDSKLYKDGLITIDHHLTLYPTEKMFEIMENLCGDVVK